MLEYITNRPDLYDMLYSDFIDDIDMYIDFAKSHKEILLCGAGTGRTTFPIAKSGISVVALDISDSMLGLLVDKLNKLPLHIQNRVSVIKEDMRNFRIEQRFTCCIVPFSTFNYLLTLEDQVNALISIKNHLFDKGELILELLSANTFPELMNGCGKVKSFDKIYNNNNVSMTRTTSFDSATQILTQEREYITRYSNGVEDKCVLLWENRFFFLGEIILLLNKCGYQIKNIYGDYNFGEFNNNSEFIVIKAIAVD